MKGLREIAEARVIADTKGDRASYLARCRASGIEDTDGADIWDDLIDKQVERIEAQAAHIYDRIMARAAEIRAAAQ